jgi:hypothetical protein
MSDSNQKGFFHRATGVPFTTFITGGGSAHLETKRLLGQQLIQLKEQRKQQLQLARDLEKQRREIEDNIVMLQQVSGEAETKLGKIEQKRIEVEKRMQERHEYPFKPDINNAPPAIFWWMVGKIPYVGPVITTVKTGKDIGMGVKNEIEDRRALKQLTEKAETHSGFKEATDSYALELKALAKELQGKETASLNVIKTMQHKIQVTQDVEQKY